MNVLAGCHEARSAVEIRESPCPVSNAPVEFFLRDGILAAKARCDICGYAFFRPVCPCVKCSSTEINAVTGSASRYVIKA